MKFTDAYKKINNGDCIALKESKGFLTPFTKFFTRSQYAHVGIAFWIDDELWMAEINGGKNHIVPLAQWDDTPFDVYESPISDADAIKRSIMSLSRMRINYGFIALFVIGLLDFLKINTFIHARKILVCSGYCVAIYEGAGWPEHTRILSPQDLTDLLEFKFEVTLD